jgi:hypothetical protein
VLCLGDLLDDCFDVTAEHKIQTPWIFDGQPAYIKMMEFPLYDGFSVIRSIVIFSNICDYGINGC